MGLFSFLDLGLARKLDRILLNQGNIMSALDTLEVEVSETTTVMASAVALLQGLKAKLDAAGTDPVKLAALSEALDTNTNALAAAITANTPAE